MSESNIFEMFMGAHYHSYNSLVELCKVYQNLCSQQSNQVSLSDFQECDVWDLLGSLIDAVESNKSSIAKLEDNQNLYPEFFSSDRLEKPVRPSYYEKDDPLFGDSGQNDAHGFDKIESCILDVIGVPDLKKVRDHYESNYAFKVLHKLRGWLQRCIGRRSNIQNVIGLDSALPRNVNFTVNGETGFQAVDHTKKSIMAGSVDPDAKLRSRQDYTCEELENESKFFKIIFKLLISGNSKKASKYAELCQRSWVAVIISGGDLLRYNFDESKKQVAKKLRVHGNPSRKIWLEHCYNLSLQNGLVDYERAVYAFLAGSVQSVLPVCDDIYSILMAHVNSYYQKCLKNILCTTDSAEDAEMNDIEIEMISSARSNRERNLSPTDVAADPRDISEIYVKLSDRVNNSYLNPFSEMLFNVIFRVVLGDLRGCLESLEQYINLESNENSSQTLRFAAHLAYVLQTVFPNPSNSEITAKIVKSYIDIIIENYEVHNVSLLQFLALLPRMDRLDCLARYMCSIEPAGWDGVLSSQSDNIDDSAKLAQFFIRNLCNTRFLANSNSNPVAEASQFLEEAHAKGSIPARNYVQLLNIICRFMIENDEFHDIAAFIKSQISLIDELRHQQKASEFPFHELECYCRYAEHRLSAPASLLAGGSRLSPGFDEESSLNFIETGKSILSDEFFLFAHTKDVDSEEEYEKIAFIRSQILRNITMDLISVISKSNMEYVANGLALQLSVRRNELLSTKLFAKDDLQSIAKVLCRSQLALLFPKN